MNTDPVAALHAAFNSARLWEARHRRAPTEETFGPYSRAVRLQLALTPDGHPTKPIVLAELATALVSIPQLDMGIVAQERLDEALALANAAVLTVNGPATHHTLVARATVLRHMFEARSTNVEALEGAITDLRTCLDLIAEGDATSLGRIRKELGTLLYHRHLHSGVPGDLLTALDLLHRAHEDLEADPVESIAALGNFAAAAMVANEMTGNDRFSRDGLAAARRVLELHEDLEDGERKASACENVALHLVRRFDHTNDSTALADALRAYESAVRATPHRGPDRARRLCGLASALALSYRVTGTRADLDHAVGLAREARDVVPAGHYVHGQVLAALAAVLRTYFPKDRDIARMREAEALLREAVAETPTTSPDYLVHRLNHVGALLHCYDESRDADLLVVADRATREVLDRMPAHHSGHAAALRARGTVTHQLALLDPADHALAAEALDCMESAAYRPDAPDRQIDAAAKAALVASGMKQWERSARLSAHAVSLLPRLASRRLFRFDQERLLARFGGLAREACAYALEAGDEPGALAVLEQGREILNSQILENRDDLAELRALHPELAARMDACRTRLSPASHAGTEPTAAERDEIHAAAGQWEALVEEARRLPGFEGLFATMPHDDLIALADGGPIVVVNVASWRTDALLVTSAGLEVVELPHAGLADLREHYHRFTSATEREEGSTPQDMADTLAWLWDVVAEPVLERLGSTGGARLWWSPTGPLVFLPLHAAGRHQETNGAAPQTVMDHVISSYTPTLRSLALARNRPAAVPGNTRLLVVAVPDVPDEVRLTAAVLEAEHLTDRAGADVLSDEHATRDAVLDALPRYECVHFACHAVQDVRMPTAGSLLLHDNLTAPLTVRDIGELDLSRAEIAFLSACATGRGGIALTEEAIHLASAFRLSGYRHVIATLWQVGDYVALRFVRAVYERIRDEGPSATARAVHDAVLLLRAKYPDRPMLWASHFHTGA